MAAHYPERLGRLVLTSCDAYDQVPPPAIAPFLLLPRVPGLTRAALALLRTRLGGWGISALLAHARDPKVLLFSSVNPGCAQAVWCSGCYRTSERWCPSPRIRLADTRCIATLSSSSTSSSCHGTDRSTDFNRRT